MSELSYSSSFSLLKASSDIIANVRVKIHSAKNIEPSACVVLKYGLIVLKSGVCKKNEEDNTVIWDEEFNIPIKKPFESMQISLHDFETKVGENSSHNLGYINIRIIEIGDQKEHTQELVLNSSALLMVSLKLTAKPEWESAYIGAHAFVNGNYGPANRLLSQAVHSPELKSFRFDLFVLRTALFLERKEYQDASINAQAAIDERPDSEEGYFRMGLVYFEMKDMVQAKKSFDHGLLINPNHEEMKNYNSYIDHIALEKDIKTTLDDAVKVFVQNKLPEALTLIDEARGSNPKEPIYCFYRAAVHLGAKNWNEAIKDVMQACEFDSSMIKEDCNLSGELQKKGEINIAYKRRWFVLKENFYMYYFKSSVDQVPQGVILIFKAIITQKGRDILVKTYLRDFKLKANTDAEAEMWTNMLQKCAKSPLRLPRQLDREVPKKSFSINFERNEQAPTICEDIAQKIKKVIWKNIVEEDFVKVMKCSKYNGWNRRYAIIQYPCLYVWFSQPTKIPKKGSKELKVKEQHIICIDLDTATVIETSDAKLGFSLEIVYFLRIGGAKMTRVIQFESDEIRKKWKQSIVNMPKKDARESTMNSVQKESEFNHRISSIENKDVADISVSPRLSRTIISDGSEPNSYDNSYEGNVWKDSNKRDFPVGRSGDTRRSISVSGNSFYSTMMLQNSLAEESGNFKSQSSSFGNNYNEDGDRSSYESDDGGKERKTGSRMTDRFFKQFGNANYSRFEEDETQLQEVFGDTGKHNPRYFEEKSAFKQPPKVQLKFNKLPDTIPLLEENDPYLRSFGDEPEKKSSCYDCCVSCCCCEDEYEEVEVGGEEESTCTLF